MVASGLPDDAVKVKLDSDDEQYSHFNFTNFCLMYLLVLAKDALRNQCN